RSTDPAGDGVRLAAARLGLSQRQSRDEQHDPHVLTPEMVQTVKYTQTLNMPFAIPTGENDTLFILLIILPLLPLSPPLGAVHPERARGTRASEGSACGRSFAPAALRMTSPLAPRNGRKKLQPPFRRPRSLGLGSPPRPLRRSRVPLARSRPTAGRGAGG